ncbi:MAG: hypothetical protein KIH89_002720 [Candidatus Shapirobacteria bacterium]|nr:hypothetical protein [Candidatus Shapirobacteria bacterium]
MKEKAIRKILNLSVTLLDIDVTCLTTIKAKITYKKERAMKNILVILKK